MYWAAEQLAAKTAHTVSICIIATSNYLSVCTLFLSHLQPEIFLKY